MSLLPINSTLKYFLSICILTTVLLTASGCANHSSATLSPGADLSRLKTFYLIPGEQDKDNYELIKTNLEKRGYGVVVGPKIQPPYQADAVVTYVDKWMWDITMYMIELTITMRDPVNEFPLAVGNSMHTSLSRLSPEEMVDEVLTNMFNTKQTKRKTNHE